MRTTLSPSAPLGAGLGGRLRHGTMEVLRRIGAGLSRVLEVTIEARYREAERETERVMRLNKSIPEEVRREVLSRRHVRR